MMNQSTELFYDDVKAVSADRIARKETPDNRWWKKRPTRGIWMEKREREREREREK